MPEFVRPFESATLDVLGRTAARLQEEKGLDADLYEAREDYLVVIDAPGAEAADVQARYVDGRVEVRVDRFRAFRAGSELRYPGRALTLSGSVALPEDAVVDADAASASLEPDGTLRITLPTEATADES
jgi:HSP20 family molecular chaperone IbpA